MQKYSAEPMKPLDASTSTRRGDAGRFRELAGGDHEPLLMEAACNVLLATRG